MLAPGKVASTEWRASVAQVYLRAADITRVTRNVAQRGTHVGWLDQVGGSSDGESDEEGEGQGKLHPGGFWSSVEEAQSN